MGASAPASAATIVLGTSGWQASWDSSLDPFVDVIVQAVVGNAVIIEKSAEFTQGPGFGGLIPAIPIAFTQIAPNASTQIVITDEIITNSSGVDWTDFHFDLLDAGQVAFNPALTDASAGGLGFFTSPFDNQTFSGDNLSFWVDGFGLGPGGSNAIIANGTQWFPGDGVTNGELFIDVVIGACLTPGAPDCTTFILKEQPTIIPEPGTLALVAFGAVLLGVTRRRG